MGLARFNELWWGSERATDNRTFERSLGIRVDTLFWFLLNFLLTFASPAIYYHIAGPAQSDPNLCVIFKYFLNNSAAWTSHSRRNWKVPRKWQTLYLCMFFKRTTHTHTYSQVSVCVLCRWSVWKINCETRCFCTSCNNSWKAPNKTNLTNCKISYCDCVCHCVSLQLCTQVLYTSLPLSVSLSLSLSLSHTHTYVRELWHCSCARTSENASYENLCENACSFVAAKAHWTVQIASNLIFPFLFCFYSRNQLAAPIAHHTGSVSSPTSPAAPSTCTCSHFGPAGAQQLCVIPKSARSTFRVQTLY